MTNSIASVSPPHSATPAEPVRNAPPNPRAGAAAWQGEARQQLNAAIVSSSLEVSIQAGNEPLALLYRSAIERLNEVLAPEFGANAIQNAGSQDFSPEATAGRIVSLSTGFFEAYRKQHPGEDEAVLLEKFMGLIRGGFEKGYAEASGILQGLGVLGGDIAAGVERTRELVLKGYDDFVAGYGKSAEAAAT